MGSVYLLIFTLVLYGYVRGQNNITVMDNEISNRIENQPPQHSSIANMKYACGLTLERYNDTGEQNVTKESKTRLALVCCPGYKRDGRGICQPFCTGGCGDGFCEFPEICSCAHKKCAFNTVERRCACFDAVCPGGCPANGTCIADNTCDCNVGFVRKSNWTSQYTNSTAECIPYCYPFCSNHMMSTSPEHCFCNYAPVDNTTTFNKNGSVAEQRNSQAYLGHMFQSHGHPSFASGLTGLALGAAVGYMIGSHGKNKYGKGGQVYGMPGGYGGYGGGGNYGYPGHNTGTNYGYGAPPNSQYGGNYGQPGGYPQGVPPNNNYGHGVPPNTNYGHGVPPNTNYGHGVPPNTNYGHGVPPNTNYGHGVPPNTNYGHGVPPNTNYGAGNNPQYPGTPYGQPVPSAPVQPQPGTGVSHGNAGQPGNTNYGWNTPAQNAQNPGTNVEQKTANTYNSAPGQPSSGTNLGSGTNTGTGQRTGTNYGWNVPDSTHTGSTGSNSNKNYGWDVPSSTNTGSNTGTAPKGTGTSSSGTSSWPSGGSNSGGDSSGKGSGTGGRSNSGGSSGRGSGGKRRGRKH